MPKVTVIIVNWNSWPLLETCLQKLAQQSYQDFKVIVIDNASTQAMPEGLPARYEHVQFLHNKINTGFAAANNQAAALCSSTDLLVLLNPDAFPETDWLEKLLTAAAQNPDFAVFASRQLKFDQPQQLDGDGDVYHISGLVWREGHGKPLSRAVSSPKEVFSACAAAALYRAYAFLAVGGFDEDYFCYVEDVDLGFRLRLAGYKCLLVPDAIVHHVGSASTGSQHSDFAVYHGHRNLLWTFVKNMPGALFWGLLPLHLLLTLVTLGVFSMRGQGKIIAKAKWDGVKGLVKNWKKRQLIQSNRIVPVREIWRVLDKSLYK